MERGGGMGGIDLIVATRRLEEDDHRDILTTQGGP
jgi:hypothetical protein